MVYSPNIVGRRKAVVFDLDGTLLDSSKRVPPANVEAVLRLQSRSDVLVAFATARPPYATFPLLGALGQAGHVICYNGAVIYHQGREINRTLIPGEAVRTLVERIAAQFPELAMGVEHQLGMHAVGNFDRHFPRDYRAGLTHAELPLTATAKILIDIPSAAHIKPVRALLPDDCGSVLTDQEGLLQVMSKGVSKRSAVECVLRTNGIEWADALCFGDDLNDLELFQSCGACVAMGNSHPELARHATHHTQTNDEGGVALALARFFPR